MDFGNPIVGNENLIRSAIQSENFNNSSTGVTGWRITKDGQATFYNVTIGSPEYNIDEDGNAVFSSVSADTILVGGENILNIIGDYPRGVIVRSSSPTSSGNYTSGTDLLWNRIVIPSFDAARMYKIGSLCHINKQGAAPNFLRQRVRYSWDTPTTTGSPELHTLQKSQATSALFDDTLQAEFVLPVMTISGTDLHLGFYIDSGSVSGMRLEGKPYNKAWVEDVGYYVPEGTFNASGGGGNPTQQYTKDYLCTDSSSFLQSGTNRGVFEMYQGYYSSTNGNQYSMMIWDAAQIQADLSGATVDRVQVQLKNTHSYLNSGITAYVGSHNQSNLNGSHSSGQITTGLATVSFAKGQQLWFDVPTSFGTELKNNTKRGLALGPAPNTSQNNYGYWAGNTQPGEPVLRITYTK